MDVTGLIHYSSNHSLFILSFIITPPNALMTLWLLSQRYLLFCCSSQIRGITMEVVTLATSTDYIPGAGDLLEIDISVKYIC